MIYQKNRMDIKFIGYETISCGALLTPALSALSRSLDVVPLSFTSMVKPYSCPWISCILRFTGQGLCSA